MKKRLYVGNIPYHLNEADITDLFTQNGFVVESVRVILDKETGRPKGFAFVELDSPQAAKDAIQNMAIEVEGRVLRVDYAVDRTNFKPKNQPHSHSGGNDYGWNDSSSSDRQGRRSYR